jgi:hypothetical protein
MRFTSGEYRADITSTSLSISGRCRLQSRLQIRTMSTWHRMNLKIAGSFLMWRTIFRFPLILDIVSSSYQSSSASKCRKVISVLQWQLFCIGHPWTEETAKFVIYCSITYKVYGWVYFSWPCFDMWVLLPQVCIDWLLVNFKVPSLGIVFALME